MNIRKTLAALTAAAALIPLSTAAAASADEPDPTEIHGIQVLAPEWIPDDLESAIKFHNTYGAVHIQGDYVCIVFPEDIMTGPASTIGQERYSFEVTGNAMTEVKYKKIIGKQSKDLTVAVYCSQRPGSFDISVIDTWMQDTQPDLGITNEAAHYSFSVDNYLNITETDIFSWLPDSPAEFSEYVEKNGPISLKDNLVLFCLSQNSGTAYEWSRFQKSGDCLALKKVSNASEIEDTLRDGGTDNLVYIFEGIKDGYDKITFSYAPVYSSSEPEETVTADCVVLDNGQTVLFPKDKRITVLDYDSGEPIDVTKNKGFAVKQIVNTPGVSPTIADITSNPCILRNMELPIDESTYLAMPYGFKAPTIPDTILVSDDHVEVTKYENGAESIAYKVISDPSGDINGDGLFNIADILMMQKWLLSGSETELSDWSAGDYTKDGIIDVFDLVLMRKAVINKPMAPVALELIQAGGFMGTYNKWKVYYEDGEYKLAAPKRGGLVRNDETVVYDITKEEYLSIMSVDYAEIIANAPDPFGPQMADSFSYNYKITFANGETAEALHFRSDVMNIIHDIARHYQNTDQTESWGTQE
ncbi:dockerin type I repeat-containing protein [Ruminococcus sp.]|uniref:dockerin type I repeat-containing protein n=1 Tax=Ruminococcus sp. TaxID=41978 RepID=UPI0025CF0C1E|nr:dockerin type I repeat-containing protein [Ruminococcus sp.]